MLIRHMDAIAESLRALSGKYSGLDDFLDVGCGDGSRTLLFDDGRRDLHGVDFMDWLGSGARARVNLREADIMKGGLPYGDSSFDLVLSFDVIEHLERPEAALGEMRRVLRRHGVLLLSTPNRNRPYGVLLSAAGMRRFPYGQEKAEDPYARHIREYAAPELCGLAASAGLSVEKVNRLFYGITGWYGVASALSLPLCHNIMLECRKV